MKRLILIVVLVMLAFWIVRAEHRARWAPLGPPGPPTRPQFAQFDEIKRHVKVKAPKPARRTVDEVRQALHEAHDEVRQAVDEARNEFRQAIDEMRKDVRQAVDEVNAVAVSDDDGPPRPAQPPVVPAPAAAPTRPEVSAVVVAPAAVQPQETPDSSQEPGEINIQVEANLADAAAAPTSRLSEGKVDGLISSTKERAEADARQKLREAVAAWLDPEVPQSWTPPAKLLNSMVQKTQFERVDKPYGTLYLAHLQVDSSPGRRASLVAVYNRELVSRRLIKLGGSLGFILICLAAVSGYIRADEATKGYYTKRLRTLAAAGVGAAGVIIYQMLARA